MPALINKTCTNCTRCENICPTKSIYVGYSHYVVDSDTCEECRICVPICPVGAIELRPRSEFPQEEPPRPDPSAKETKSSDGSTPKEKK